MTHVNAQFPLAPSLFVVKVTPQFHPSRIAGRFFRLRGAATGLVGVKRRRKRRFNATTARF
jgi:hypothetical protein